MFSLNIIFDAFIFFLGLAIGSFLNCVIYRLEKNQSFVRGRSQCPNCNHILTWLDLIPVASYFFLQGKCRYCKKSISWQYPLVEIITGFVFLFIFWGQYGSGGAFLFFPFQSISQLAFLLYIASVLIIIFVYDLKYYLIPDKVLFPAIVIAFLYRLYDISFFGGFVLAMVIAAGFFLLIFLVSKGNWMGFGDVKLAILLGLFLGFPNILVALFTAFLLGAVVGSVLMLLRKKGLKSEIPFAPFLILGTFLATLFGTPIIHWYLNFLI